MIWLLTILLPLLAAVLTPFWPAAKRGAGWVFAAAAVPALWLGLVEVSGITLPWLFLGSDFSLDTPRRIILLLTAILWATAGLFADDYLRHRSEERRVGKECRTRESRCQAEDGIRDADVTGVQTCALPILGLCCRCCACALAWTGGSFGHYTALAFPGFGFFARYTTSHHPVADGHSMGHGGTVCGRLPQARCAPWTVCLLFWADYGGKFRLADIR